MNGFREKYIGLFHFNEELRGIVESVLGKHPHPKGKRQVFLLYALAKSYKTQAAVLFLAKSGYGQDAGILTRSIFELAITTLYIVNDITGGRVERFFDYDWVMRENLYNSVAKDEALSRGAEGFKEKDPSGETIETILKKARDVKERYPDLRKFSWSDKKFKEMAEEVGRIDIYKTAYHLQCNLAHPNPRNTNDYFSESGGRLQVNAGPGDDWVMQSLVAAFDFFITIVGEWNKEFKFALDDKLDDLVARYHQKMKVIRGIDQ